MPKLRSLSASEVVRLLRAHGFVLVHQRGSHIIYHRQLPGGDSSTRRASVEGQAPRIIRLHRVFDEVLTLT
jgi:hypothetical protein